VSHLPEVFNGSAPRSFGEFRNAAGAFADPQTVRVSILKPDLSPITLTYGVDADVIKDAVGKYHIDLDANIEGVWKVRWFAEGIGKAATEMRFRVLESDFV
jgi:hypothetical protein